MSLNFLLYKKLVHHFGQVDVKCEGEEAKGYITVDPFNGRKSMNYISWGERYVMDCPFCGDTRGRMAVSHMYGTKEIDSNYNNYSLWKCLNEECQSVPSYRDRLQDILSTNISTVGRKYNVGAYSPKVKIVRSIDLPTAEFPGVLKPLAELPSDHRAIQYLESRSYDIKELNDIYKISYIDHIPTRCREVMAKDRIFIPVYHREVMVGWQARFIGDNVNFKKSGIQKYLTFFPKSQILYNIDRVDTTDAPLVVVEGATDTWRYGDNAVAMFGKAASTRQIQLLIESSSKGEKPIYFLVDGDDAEAINEAYKNVSKLITFGFSYDIQILPISKGKDPANFSRLTLHSLVQKIKSDVEDKYAESSKEKSPDANTTVLS